MVDWKKEIKLSDLVRRKKEEDVEGHEAVDPVEEPEQKIPFWKKEISLGGKRKRKAQPEFEFEIESDPVEDPGPKTSIWKKEISFGRKRSKPEPEVEPESEPVPTQPEPLAPEAAPEAPSMIREAAAEVVSLEPEEEVTAPMPSVEERPPAEVVPLHAGDPPAPMPPPPTPQEPAPAASFPPTPVEEPMPDPAPAVEPTDEGPEPEPETKKIPFWKKELSLKRGERQVEPDAEYAPRKPFWKKELPRPRFERRERGGSGAKRLVGLKIGASQLAAARVANNGIPELLQVAREPLAPGVVAGGELRDPEALAAALKGFFRKNKLPRRGIRLGIANNRIGVRSFEVSGIEDPKQLDNAIRFRAQEALPIPIEEAVLDYQILGESVDEEGTVTKRVLLVVAYRELVDRYVAACKKAGLRLAGIDLEAFALLRALSEPPAEHAAAPEAATVAVAIGHQRSTFAVSDGRSCEFTRVLDWGGASLDVAVARELDLTPSQAEPFKRMLSLEPGAPPPEGLTEEQNVKALDAVRRQLQAFARELVSSLQFYQNQPGSLGIGEIVVTGGTAHLPGIAAELQRLIGVLVRVGDPLARVKIGKRVDEDDQVGSLAIAIGLGIED